MKDPFPDVEQYYKDIAEVHNMTVREVKIMRGAIFEVSELEKWGITIDEANRD